MLRELGCTLPIEVWYLGEGERNRAWEELVAPLDVRCVDAHEVRKQHPHARLNGFESKPYAIQWSRFAEVLYLDADNVPVRDPTFLFDTPQYAGCGAIFWPDYHRLSRDRAAWRVFGNVPYRDEPEVESGQVVIDKARCWRALTFANWCGERSAFFFNHVYGDKELFHLCWRKLGQEYAMPTPRYPHAAGHDVPARFRGPTGSSSIATGGSGRSTTIRRCRGFSTRRNALRYVAELKASGRRRLRRWRARRIGRRSRRWTGGGSSTTAWATTTGPWCFGATGRSAWAGLAVSGTGRFGTGGC